MSGKRIPDGPRDFTEDEDEPYHMRMFMADSLYPSGAENFNTGPLYALREDQMNSQRFPGVFSMTGRDDFGGNVSQGSVPISDSKEGFQSSPRPERKKKSSEQVSDEKEWMDEQGYPNRDPSQAIVEFWGGGHTDLKKIPPTNRTRLGGTEQMRAPTYGEIYAWGNKWLDNDGTRFMRYESIPFWQKGGREGIDYEIEETLGTGEREMDNLIRRWDTSRMKDPRAQEYRRYGPRSGYIV